ncbi:MAG TPA: SpoIVB peptidase S55 domain-containing protein [Thermoanaerobaculia bacterium]|nr:SpoIVB peptidase S55 domain-containing protein [Thermoanaerobaculia bacterium]
MQPKQIVLAIALLLTAVAASADTMPLSQIHKGMKGYGLTVFEGTKVERFDVEILGVLNNIGPSQDLIMARVDSPTVQRAGVIAGMSGSPIYIDGKVIGALAYSWQFSKEPIAGITPIEEMLKLARSEGSSSGGVVPAAAVPRISGSDFLKALGESKTDDVFQKIATSFGAKATSTMSGAHPIAVPLSMSSFDAATVSRFGPYFEQMGFVSVPAGSMSTSTTRTTADTKKAFAVGDAIGAVLMNGDFTVAATGTVTHIDGDRIYAFGHPFLDMGEVSFPMTQSEIVTVLPSLASSFKLANTGNVVGALRQDRASGIMGVLGDKADTIPVELTVNGSNAGRTYHLNVVRHAQLSPLILAMAADTVIANVQRAAGERTIMLESEIKLKGFEPIHLREGWAGAQARQAIPQYLAVIAGYLMSNEFRDATIESVKLNVRHDDQLKTAKLMEASIDTPDHGEIHPGDTVKVRALLKPYRGEPFRETFDVKVPENQTPGPAYLLVGSGTALNQIDFSLVPPDPRTLEQVLGVLERLRPSTDLTVGLYSTGEGAVTAGVYLPNLPPSVRAIVAADTSNAAQAPVKYHGIDHQARSLGYIIDGAVKIDLDVRPAI